MLYKPSVPAVNVLPGGGNEEQGLVQVGLRLLTAAGVAAAQLSTGMTGSMQNMNLCNLAHKSGQKVLQLITFGLKCCGAAEGRETLMGNILWLVLLLLYSLKLGALPGRLQRMQEQRK